MTSFCKRSIAEFRKGSSAEEFEEVAAGGRIDWDPGSGGEQIERLLPSSTSSLLLLPLLPGLPLLLLLLPAKLMLEFEHLTCVTTIAAEFPSSSFLLSDSIEIFLSSALDVAGDAAADVEIGEKTF